MKSKKRGLTKALLIKPEYALLSDKAKVAYTTILLQTNSHGYIGADPDYIFDTIFATCISWSRAEVMAAVQELLDSGLLEAYIKGEELPEYGKVSYLKISDFDSMQHRDILRKRGSDYLVNIGVKTAPEKFAICEISARRDLEIMLEDSQIIYVDFAGKKASPDTIVKGWDLEVPRGRAIKNLNKKYNKLYEKPKTDSHLNSTLGINTLNGCAAATAAGSQQPLIEEEIIPPKTISEKDRKQKLDEAAKRVYLYWVEQTWGGRGVRPALDSARKNKIIARLNEGRSVNELKSVVDFYRVDPWHKGDNPQKKQYLGIQTIFKSAEKVESALGMIGDPAALSVTQQAEQEINRLSPMERLAHDMAFEPWLYRKNGDMQDLQGELYMTRQQLINQYNSEHA